MQLSAVLLAIVCSLLVPVTGMMAMFAPMAMDAPDSNKSPGKWLFVVTMMASPLALLGAAVVSWKRIMAGDYQNAVLYCVLSLIPFGIAMLLLRLNWLEKGPK